MTTSSDSLRTDRLDLRFVTVADLPALHALDNDREVMRYTNGGVSISVAEYEREILPVMLTRNPRYPELGFRAAIERASGAFVGWFALRAVGGSPQVARLGYRLRRSAWGRGLGTEGARAVLDRAFAGGHVRRVVATVYEDNRASIGVAEGLGMRELRRYSPDDEELEAMDTYKTDPGVRWSGLDIEFAIDRDDWVD